jgi:recombination protein RecA
MSKLPSFMSKLVRDGKATVASTLSEQPTEFLSTGSPSLDWAIGGGIPKGKITVLWGPNGAGKSWLSQKIAAQILEDNKEKYGIWIDTEFSFDPSRAEYLGIDMDRLFVIQGNTPGDVIPPLGKMENDIMADKNLGFVVVDSIKGLVSVNEANQMEDGNIDSAANAFGGIAKTINPLLSILVRWAHNLNIPVIMINHISSNMDVMTAKYTPHIMGGGEKLKHMMTVCCYLSKVTAKDAKIVDESIKSMNGAEVVEGYTIRARINKTRYTVEGKVAEFAVNFSTGEIQQKEVEITKLAKSLNIITTEGQSLVYKEHKIRFEKGFSDFLKDNPSVYESIRADIAAETKKKLFKPTVEPKTSSVNAFQESVDDLLEDLVLDEVNTKSKKSKK